MRKTLDAVELRYETPGAKGRKPNIVKIKKGALDKIDDLYKMPKPRRRKTPAQNFKEISRLFWLICSLFVRS